MEDDEDATEGTTNSPDGMISTALDKHYYLVGDVVHLEEAEKPRQLEAYFLSQISQGEEILKMLE